VLAPFSELKVVPVEDRPHMFHVAKAKDFPKETSRQVKAHFIHGDILTMPDVYALPFPVDLAICDVPQGITKRSDLHLNPWDETAFGEADFHALLVKLIGWMTINATFIFYVSREQYVILCTVGKALVRSRTPQLSPHVRSFCSFAWLRAIAPPFPSPLVCRGSPIRR
jgi:hypothetical protein